MKSTTNTGQKNAPESMEKKGKSKTAAGKDNKTQVKSQAPGTTGRRKPPPPTDTDIVPGES